jgi:hypothetical protein
LLEILMTLQGPIFRSAVNRRRVMDLAARCRAEAQRCRRLAQALGEDPACDQLLAMAEEYETEARRQEARGERNAAAPA